MMYENRVYLRSCNTPSNPWTGGTYSWQLSRIICRSHRPTRVFCVHFVLTHAHPRKLSSRSPIPNCSKPSTLNLEVLLRYASEKEDAPCWYGYSINSIKPWARTSPSQGLGYHGSCDKLPVVEVESYGLISTKNILLLVKNRQHLPYTVRFLKPADK
jgi:hypothetical protein